MRISMCYKRFLFVFFFAILCFHITPSVVMGMSGQRSHAQSCKPGNTFEVTITIEYTEDIMVIGLQETIPAGWEYVSASCDIQAPFFPEEGDMETIDFAWLGQIPESPIDLKIQIANTS